MQGKLSGHVQIETAQGFWRLAELRECERHPNTRKERGRIHGRLKQGVTGPKGKQVLELTRSE